MNTTALLENPGEVSADSTPAPSGPVVGVRTTRIYCRPVCRPGRAPKPENCVPFADAEAARASGYRACKQCRPDDAEPPARYRRSTKPAETLGYAVGPTPIGPALVAMTPRGICSIYILDGDDPSPGLERLRRENPHATITEDPAIGPYVERIVAYIVEGRPCDDLPLDLRGTPFQLRVWEALRTIPRGETVSYGDLARRLGLPPGASRAVGTACGSNPVGLIVPCHRVVRTGGGLGGYYWGLDRKKLLLELEQSRP